MDIKGIIDEDFVNYKKCSMIIEFPICNFKCDKEYGLSICQNGKLTNIKNTNISIEGIIDRYIKNDLSEAIVMQGLEPFDSFNNLYQFIKEFRKVSNDDIVIYTGYKEHEIKYRTDLLKEFVNIIIKFGRFIPNSKKRYDDILGVWLASDNQYAKHI